MGHHWVLLVFCITSGHAKVYFEDRFLDGNIDKWHMSKRDNDGLGVCEFARPKATFDEKEDGGIRTTNDARFYRYSSPLSETLSSEDKTVCIQFSVKHEQEIDCGGGYVKLIGESFDPDNFHADTPYEIMFGPDICGYGKKMVHVIFYYKGQNHLVKKDIDCKSDTLSHLYTLIVKSDNTFEVLIDQKSVEKGSLEDDFDIIPPKKIDDPSAKKPSDWVDEADIPDPDDKMSEDWDQPKTIVDENSKRPDDWDDETDGDWQAPMVDNPQYKGEWHPKTIPNPAFKGEWTPPQIDNPDYLQDPNIYARRIGHIGLDLWQVKSGTIFDNFIISDDVSECEDHGKIWKKRFEFEVEQVKKGDEDDNKKAAPEEDGVEEEEEYDEPVNKDEL